MHLFCVCCAKIPGALPLRPGSLVPDSAPVPASRLRYKMLSSSNGSTGFPAEYFSYTTPITYGHNSAAGANGVAAYSPFRPNIPEDFTSTGPVRIVGDAVTWRRPAGTAEIEILRVEYA